MLCITTDTGFFPISYCVPLKVRVKSVWYSWKSKVRQKWELSALIFSAVMFICVMNLGPLMCRINAIDLDKLRGQLHLEDKRRATQIEEYDSLHSQEDSTFEPAPMGTLNNPVKVKYDKGNIADLAMNDAMYRYFNEQFSDQILLDDDYSGYFVLTRRGYEYESLTTTNPVSQNGDLGKTKTNDFWNGMIRNLPANKIPKSIFPPDTREEITNTSTYPYSSIGYVESGCTGTFVGPKHVLTAAHCVYSTMNKAWREKLNIRRAKSCNPDQGHYHSWKYAIISKGWKLLGLPAYDYAIIVVNEPSSSQLDIAWLDAMPEVPVSVNGYPGDKSGICLWGSWCELVWKSKYQLGHSCDTYYGMSGSSVFAKEESTGKMVVYCVHAYGGGQHETFNRCTRITEIRYNLIKSWLNLY